LLILGGWDPKGAGRRCGLGVERRRDGNGMRLICE
jgi:hypothetical protein